MLDFLVDFISDEWWTYPFLALFALLDSIVPIVPSETAVITAGVAAASDRLNLLGIIAVAAAGAVVGDNIAYLIGRRAKPWVERRFSGPKATERLAWARRQLHARGTGLIVVARFIPGGRTAVTVTSGMTAMPHGKFFLATVVAGLIWGTYAALLGFYGGKQFEDEPTKALLLAFGIAVTVLALTEVARYLIRRRSRTSA
jgi:membrane-associated protein